MQISNNEILPKNKDGCPFLFLAPMEGIGDPPFRKAMASIGGFDQACTEFLRVPLNAHVQSLARKYQADVTHPIPQAAQIMGSDPELMAQMSVEIAKRGAPRIDLNCGCPSNTVTGKGAGSSLLKDPNQLYKVAKAMVESVTIPVTAKLRSGFEDTSLFKENILAAQESGIRFLTLHPRTKVDGYGPPAKWEYIAEAKQVLKIPVVGNGDILNVQDALSMLKQTGCDALMIGRGGVINPFIFHQIKGYFAGIGYTPGWDSFVKYLNTFIDHIPQEMELRNKMNKLKSIFSFLFRANPQLEAKRNQILTANFSTVQGYLDFVLPLLREGFLITYDYEN